MFLGYHEASSESERRMTVSPSFTSLSIEILTGVVGVHRVRDEGMHTLARLRAFTSRARSHLCSMRLGLRPRFLPIDRWSGAGGGACPPDCTLEGTVASISEMNFRASSSDPCESSVVY
jgi:hypothetical protein